MRREVGDLATSTYQMAIIVTAILLAILQLSSALATSGTSLVNGGTYASDTTLLVPVPADALQTETLIITTPSSVYRYNKPKNGTLVPFTPIEEGAYQLSLLRDDGTVRDLAEFSVLRNISGNHQPTGNLSSYENAQNSSARDYGNASLVLAKLSYVVGEPIPIAVEPLPLDRSSLVVEIRRDDTVYSSQGSLPVTSRFVPDAPGEYVISLLEAGNLLDRKRVEVVSSSVQVPLQSSSQESISSSPSSSNSSFTSSSISPSPFYNSSSHSYNTSSSSSSYSYLHTSDISSLPEVSLGGIPSTLPIARRIFPGLKRRLQPGAVAPTPASEKESKDEAKARFRASFSQASLAGSFSSDEPVRIELTTSGTIATRLSVALGAGYLSQSLTSPLLSLSSSSSSAGVSKPLSQALTLNPATDGGVSMSGALSTSNLSAEVMDYQGISVDVPFTIQKENASSFSVTIPPSRAMRPGMYAVALTDLSTGTEQTTWFAYGLISVNTEHPIYHPGERARLLIVVLNSAGVPIAGAPVDLVIKAPDGRTERLSTVAGTVQPTGKRGVYQAYYNIMSDSGDAGDAIDAGGVNGKYSVLASTVLDNKPVTVSTAFTVRASFPYDITRAVPSTVDPSEGPFTNDFSIMPLTDSTGNPSPENYTLIEYLPSSFIITNTTANDIRLMNDTYIMTWYNASADEELSYEAQPPLLSPYLYSLGKAEIRYINPTNGSLVSFREARPWLFAIDPAALSCSTSPCDTSTLVDGRDTISGGAEPNQPNTIDTCTDGTSGSYHSDESLDKMVITDLNSTTFTARDTVQVNITVWCWGTADNLNWVYTNDSVTPSWRVLYSTNCPSGGSLQTFSQTFVLDDTPGNQTIRGVFQYNGANTATCGTGGYDDNDDVTLVVRDRDRVAPVHHSLVVNQTTAPINGSVKVIADVTDNVAVDGVNATVKKPDGSSQNLTLTLSNLSTSSLSGDLEAGTVTYDAVTTPPGDAEVQQGIVTFSSAQASQTITINPVNLSHAFIIVSSTADARSNADRFTYTGTFVNSTAITLARSATGTSGSAAYYVVEATNINVTNGTTTFSTTDTSIDVTIPDQGADYATKTFVVLSVQSQSSSRNYLNEAYVTGVLTSATNLRLQRDDSGNAPLSVSWFVVRFLDGTTVQTGETSVTTTGTATLSPVVTNRTWLYFTTRMSANGLAYTSIHGNLANSTQASFSRTSTSGTAYAQWFAIEFPDGQGAWAEHGLQAGSGTGEATANIAISAVNTSRSFGYVTQDSTGTGTAYPRSWWTQQLTSATNIQVARGYTGQTSNHDWQAVSWPVDPGNPDIEANKSFTTYNDVTSDSYVALENITVTTTISSYSNAGSQQRSNEDPNLEVQLYNGSAWRSIGLLNVTAQGTYSITTTDSSILTAWLNTSKRDVRVRGVNMDYSDASHFDSLSYTALNVTLHGNQTRYSADWTSTAVAGIYNVTDLWSIDTSGNTNHTTYSTVTFLVLNYGVPSITINDVEGDATETYSFTNQTPAINATIDTNATCYLSTVDESYSEMVANGRVNCGAYTMNVPKACTYTSTLPVGSETLHMACNNSFSSVTNNVTSNKDFNVDVLCDTHADCQANEYCDYTFHCAPDVLDGYECKQATFDDQPSDAVCGGGSDPGTCVNDSSYSFTGWYCAHDADDCVFNDSGNTYDYGYALCNALAGPNDYRRCSTGQLWSAVIDCGDLNEGADPNGTTHTNANCSYYATAQSCSSGDLDLGSYGCVGSATDCGPYIYTGSGLCGNVLSDCDVGCGASCDANNNTSPVIVSGVCYYDKSCSDACAWSVSQENAPSFCINDADGGQCAYSNRTDPSVSDTCYYNVTCQDVTGASLLNSSQLRQNYCDYCTESGNLSGEYAPAPNASCASNCSNNGTIWYDSSGTPLDRSDDCDGSGGTTILSDTLTYGDVWNGSGSATCDDAECELDAGPYLNGSCVGGQTGTCTFSDPEPPDLTIISPGNGTWFNESPAIFEYSVFDPGSGTANCSLIVDGAIVNTTTNPTENTTINFSYEPSLGSFTWGIECYDKSAQQNRAWSGTFDSGYDNTLPSLSNPARNGTLFDINEYVCLNVTATDTYSGISKVLAEIDLPPPYGITNITLSPGVTSCNPSGTPNVYSTEYQLVFSGPFNWTNAYAKDLAGNTARLAVGLNWSVNAAGFLEGTLLSPAQDVTINESGANDNFTMTCKARCTEQGIACENVSLAVQYDSGKGVGLWTTVNTTSENLTSNTSSAFCGDLNTSEPRWWNDSWLYRKQLNITTPGTIEQGYTVNFTLDTQSLVSAGKLRSDGNDLRIIYWNGGAWTELDRLNASAFDSASTEIRFRTQDAITTLSDKYYLYYGNPSATAPPANPVNVYFFYDDFNDGNIDGWTNFSSGVVTYASLSGNGVIEKTTNNDPNGGTAVFSRNITGYKVEFDFDRPDEAGGAQTRYALSASNNAGYGFRITDVNPSGNFQIEERNSGGSSAGNLASVATSYFSLNTWFHIVQWYNNQVVNISVYNYTSGALLGSLQATDNSVTQFDRFNIHGGYDFYTDNVIVRLYDIANAPSVLTMTEKNLTEIADQPGTSCNATFRVSSANLLSGNNTWPVRCKAYADNAPTTFSSSVNVTVNDHPNATISSPVNDTWQHGTITVNGSASYDSDGTIADYLFRYDDNVAFSSPSTICFGTSATCTWNTSAQDQCFNDTKSCYLQLIVTDDLGLATASSPVLLGFDVTGPVTILDRPVQGANITTNTYTVNASVVDGQVGTISKVLFEYRENATASWKSACNDTDGSAPFQCAWNLTGLSDGATYEFRAFANDTLGNLGGASVHTNITVDRTPPTVTLISHENATYSLGNETLYYNVTDATSTVANCTLYIDGVPVNTTQSPAEGVTLNFTVTSLAEGTRTWRVDCTDALGNVDSSENRSIIVDLTGPVVILDQPPTGGSAYGLFTVNASVSDTGVGNISQVTFLYRENSTEIWLSACNDSDGVTPFQCVWNTTALADGSSYQVRAYANDTLGNIGSANTHTSITVDNNPPVISYLNPRDGFVDTDGNIRFTYRVKDFGSGVVNCSLLINGTINQTTTNPSEGVEHAFFLNGLNDTTFDWSIDCWDTFTPQPHRAITSNRTLTVNIIYFLNDSVSTNQSVYEKGDRDGETANVTTNMTDIVNESISANVTTDIILTNGTSLDAWWNTSWTYRMRATLAETQSIDRVNQWVSIPFSPDPSCAGLAHVNSLRLVQGFNTTLKFNEWNITYCPDAVHVQSLWVTFRLNLSANESANINLYYAPGSGFTKMATDQGPMRLVWVSSGGSGNAPDTTTLKSDIDTALGSLGLSSSGFYDELATSATSTDFTLSDLQDYPIVLYDSAAKYGSSWTVAEGVSLQQYVNQSGNLFLSGQDLGYDANQDSWLYNSVWKNLTRTSAGWVDNANPTTFTVNAAHPVTQYVGSPGTTVTVTGDYEDGFTTLAGSTSVQLLNWTGSANPIAGAANDGLFDAGCNGFCGKTVYYAGLLYISSTQGIQSASARQSLFKGAIEWFLTNRSLAVSYGQKEKWIARNSTASTSGSWTWLWNVYGFAIGRYEAVSLATKTKYNDATTNTAFNISLDTKPPAVTLIEPPNASEQNSSVTFSYRVTDVLSSVANCSVYVDDAISGNPDKTIQEGIPQFFYPYIPAVGWHNWTVCCYDAYANVGCADNRTIYIKPPDLVANLSDIVISPAGPYVEGGNVTINATIWNLGGSDTLTNFTVQLWDGDPDFGGTQIGANRSINLTDQYGNHDNETLSWNWTIARPGTSALFVLIDPPLATNGTILELNESNNEVLFNITTPAYTVIYGNVTSTLLLDTSSNRTLANFSDQRNNTGLIFFTGPGSVDFNALQALGRTTTNSTATTDFSDADDLLNMTGFKDSVNEVWAQGTNTPVTTASFNLGDRVIADVPVVNSSASGAFRTGILWDNSKDTGNGQYDTADKEPIVFFTEINTSETGDYGTYDYQSKVPALLRDYAGSGGSVIYIYYELT